MSKSMLCINKTNNKILAGAVDEEIFLKSFEDVPTIQLFSHREVNDHMKGILDTISDSNKDWNKRVDAVIIFNFLLYLLFN